MAVNNLTQPAFLKPITKGGIYELEGVSIDPDEKYPNRYLAKFRLVVNGQILFFPFSWSGGPQRAGSNAHQLARVIFDNPDEITLYDFSKAEIKFPGIRCLGLVVKVRTDANKKPKPKGRQYFRIKRLFPLEQAEGGGEMQENSGGDANLYLLINKGRGG